MSWVLNNIRVISGPSLGPTPGPRPGYEDLTKNLRGVVLSDDGSGVLSL